MLTRTPLDLPTAFARKHLLDALHQASLAATVAVAFARLGDKGVIDHVECRRDDRCLRIGDEATHHAWAEAAALPISPSSSGLAGCAGAALKRRRQNRANIGCCRSARQHGRQEAGCRRQHGRVEELLASLVASSA